MIELNFVPFTPDWYVNREEFIPSLLRRIYSVELSKSLRPDILNESKLSSAPCVNARFEYDLANEHLKSSSDRALTYSYIDNEFIRGAMPSLTIDLDSLEIDPSAGGGMLGFARCELSAIIYDENDAVIYGGTVSVIIETRGSDGKVTKTVNGGIDLLSVALPEKWRLDLYGGNMWIQNSPLRVKGACFRMPFNMEVATGIATPLKSIKTDCFSSPMNSIPLANSPGFFEVVEISGDCCCE